MAIKIEKGFQTPESAAEVWKILSDPRGVASCVPGAQITEAVDDRTYKGVIKVKLGPTVTDYKGEAHIERLDDQNREIEMIGKGQDVRGKGSASMKMIGKVRELPEGGSEVITSSELNVVGILAQMGSRMIQEVANQMFEQFTRNLRQRLQQPAGAVGSGPAEEVKPIDAGSVAVSAVLRPLGRLFRPESKENDENSQ
ncbi:MAG TPA: SRPBCC family protein [Chthoniobacterales bacterium]